MNEHAHLHATLRFFKSQKTVTIRYQVNGVEKQM